jgi:hypothetical protein
VPKVELLHLVLGDDAVGLTQSLDDAEDLDVALVDGDGRSDTGRFRPPPA